MTSKQGWIRNVFLAALVATAAVSAPSAWAGKGGGGGDPIQDPTVGMSQTQLACRVWFTKTLPNFFRQRAIDIGYWFRGYASEYAALKARFDRNPQLWKALEWTQGNRYYSYDNQLKIYNTDDDMASVIKKSLGSCWGHATMKFYFTRLTFFDPRSLHEAVPFKEGTKEWINYYRAKIDQIADGRPAVVPGFRNLREFTEHPDLNRHFQYEAVQEWAEHMSSIFNAKYFISKRDYTSEEGLQFIRDVRRRLDQGYNPKIMFDENSHELVKGEENSLHVVQVVSVHQLQNDKWAIEVVDDKFGVKRAKKDGVANGEDETEVLYLNLKAGSDRKRALGVYLPWRKKDMSKPFEPGNAWDMGGGLVNQFRITPENDLEAMKMALALDAFCRRRPKVCEELGNRKGFRRARPVLEDAGGSFKPFLYPDGKKF